MQISRIGSVNFGNFYAADVNGKLDTIYNMLQDAKQERKVLAQNQAKMHFANRDACKGLCNDNYYSKATPVREAFEDVKIKQL